MLHVPSNFTLPHYDHHKTRAENSYSLLRYYICGFRFCRYWYNSSCITYFSLVNCNTFIKKGLCNITILKEQFRRHGALHIDLWFLCGMMWLVICIASGLDQILVQMISNQDLEQFELQPNFPGCWSDTHPLLLLQMLTGRSLSSVTANTPATCAS